MGLGITYKYLLSGGLSFFSSREGFICDNVLNFEVVLASSEIVNANATEHPDLFRALRGGGNNFGIVTRFDFRIFEQGSLWDGFIMYYPHSFPSQIQAYCDELNKPDASENTHIIISQGYSALLKCLGNGHLCMNQVYYTSKGDGPEVLKPYVELQPQIDQINTLRKMTLEEAANEQTNQSADNIRCAYMNKTVKTVAATLKEASDIFTKAFQPLKSLEGITCFFTLQAYPLSTLKKCDNSLGLNAERTGPLMSVLLLNWWQNKSDDDLVIGTFKKTLEEIDEMAASKDTAVRFKYMNYAYDFQDPIKSYDKEIQERLREVSTTYDAEGLFQKGAPGGFRLG